MVLKECNGLERSQLMNGLKRTNGFERSKLINGLETLLMNSLERTKWS